MEPELIAECINGNLQSFRKLVGITSQYAFSVAFRMLGDKEQAKDIVQETMITIWEKIGNIKSAGCFRTWMYRILVNKCYDQLRKIKKRKEFRADEHTWELIANHTSSEQTSDMEYIETARIINLLTNKLSPSQKAVFVLSDLEEMSAEEISEITGMSRSNIKANLHYARKRISEMIIKHI